MYKKLFFILFIFIVFFSYNIVSADIIINEVMYNLDGGDIDYFEVVNNGTSSVDLTEYKFIVNNDSVNGHGIVLNSGIQDLGIGDFGIVVVNSVISNYINKWGSSGNIFTASFSLPNSIITEIILNNKSLVQVDKFEYDPSQDGANGDGNSLQLTNGSWGVGEPTPGLVNNIISSSSSTATQNDTETLNSGGSLSTSSSQEQKIKTKIITKTLAFSNVPVEFSVSAMGRYGETLSYGKYFLNFGDGDSKEIKANETGKFTHTYFYPGEYTLNLEYYQNYFTGISDANDRVVIKVVTPDILISNVGDEKDFFIEITNNTLYEADLSMWVIASDKNNFTLPKNTILGAKKKIILSPYITNFSIIDKNTLKLMTPQWGIIHSYSASPVVYEKGISRSKILINENTPIIKISEEIHSDNLEASTILSEKGSDTSNSYIPFFSLFIFLGTTSTAVYFIRRRKISVIPGDDFELLDE